MADDKQLRARDSRDRLIDILGFGKTYPLRDLQVRDDRLTVPFDNSAKVPIDTTQRDVSYRLEDKRTGEPITRREGDADVPIEADGTGDTILLETPKIQEDVTYKILATKIESRNAADVAAPARAAHLHQTATVKVGLDVTLDARIRAPALDTTVETPADSDPRVVFYNASTRGTEVEVEIDSSQEGVDYELVDAANQRTILSRESVRGDLETIVLTTRPLTEDIDIRIRATKEFARSEDRDTQISMLDIVLPLKVRANPDVPASMTGTAIISHGRTAAIKLARTQRSVHYQLYIQNLRDQQFLYNEATRPDDLTLAVPGQSAVRVARPPRDELWHDLDRFQPAGEPKPGTGGALELRTPSLTDDSVVVIRASKVHKAGAAGDRAVSRTLESAIPLHPALLILVEPDRAPSLSVKTWIVGAETTGTLEVSGGQDGVLYEFRKGPRTASLGLPAFFHKKIDGDDRRNQGIGPDDKPGIGLRVGIDLAIARDWPAEDRPDGTTTLPLSPQIDTAALAAGTTLHVLAIKARTGVRTTLTSTAAITSVPAIRAEPGEVAAGQTSKILVPASQAGETYQLTRDGQALGETKSGDGTDLEFVTPTIDSNTSFDLVVARPEEAGIPVTRVVGVTVTVAPSE